VMNRAAGALLGHMVRAGWAVPSQGERYAVAYSITDAGREAARVRSAELEADPLCGPADPIPLDRKRCNRCGRARKRADFHRDGQNGDGLGKRCRFCGSEEQAERRAGLIVARDADAAWQRASKEVIVLRCLALIRAARVAKRGGTWRGRDGLRAYIDLGKTLDLFSGNGQDPAVSEAEACDPGDNTKPHHCDPCDSNWNRAAHSTPEHLRRRMAP